jgi:hypothetical protein
MEAPKNVPPKKPLTPEKLKARLDHLVALAVANQKAEGFELSPAEISKVRAKLKAQYEG